MATVDYTLTNEQGDPVLGSGVSHTFSWTLTSTNTDGKPIRIGSNVVDITFQINGTFGGATVAIEGTNDTTNWLTHEDVENNAMSYTAAPTALVAPRELGRRIRPNLTTAGSGASIVVTATLRIARV